MKAAHGDPLAVVEAAYRVEQSDAAWLEGVTRAARPLLDGGLGLCGGLVDFDARRTPPAVLSAPVYIGTPSGLAEGIENLLAVKELGALQARLFASGKPISTASAELGARVLKQNEAVQAHWAPLGVRDMVGVLAADPGGSIVTLVAPQARTASTSPAHVETWARLAAHLAAGHRLRQWARKGEFSDIASFAEAEAVLKPDGRVEHATQGAKSAAARGALKAAALAVDKARSVRGDKAVALWRALVEARWSLVDQFDRDGRHYLVACRNDVKAPSLKPLTNAENQVVAFAALGHANKLIAYELGLSVSTVATHLARAMKKLGVRSRLELIQNVPSSPK